MYTTTGPRRIVVWTDGSDEAAHAADWAALFAETRNLPLRVLCLPRIRTLVGTGGSAANTGLQAGERRAQALERITADVRRIQAQHPDISTNMQVIHDDLGRPGPEVLDDDDVLVTSPRGYLDLVEQADLEVHAAAHVPAPTIFVPEEADVASHQNMAQTEGRVLLLTGSKFFPAAAAFALATAADLGATMDVVELTGSSEDDAYSHWPDPERSPRAAEAQVRADSSRLRAISPDVPGNFVTLHSQPWSALRDMSATADMAVVGVGCGCGVDVRAVYDLDTCPIAIVPEP